MSAAVQSPAPVAPLPPFVNEPVLELRRRAVRDELAAASERLALPVDATAYGDGEPFDSTDPARPSRVVARARAATPARVDAAVRAAKGAYRAWSDAGAHHRAACLSRAAAHLRERRREVAALEVAECGKPWAEADADVCEAIDFLEYYGRLAILLEERPADPPLIQLPGERNRLIWSPRGVVAAIAPWNFPLAIPTGMVAAALAAGNAVCLKPAEQAPGVGLRVVEALRAGGVPEAVVHLLPGFGETGRALVEHPDVQTIAFTGSSAVGTEIMRAAAGAHKRVIAEMGGKNAIIVDADADLDDAVPAIVTSSFVYAGQKCSACERVLVHEAVHDALVERLAGAVAALHVGPADDFGTDVGPVIDDESRARLLDRIETARREGRVVAEQTDVPPDGHYVPPTVVAGLPADSVLITEELFGPVVAVTAVPSLDAALEEVDRSPFALTGGIFSRSPSTIEEVVRRSPVGNLYVNRHITGAMVGRQPFGGNRRSGTGDKAGGPDYLRQFADPRVITENTVRHGLVANG